ncbi:hypothetical protein Vretimale_13037 [Volvox reticuliferus]|uniref:Fucolectin tachylectin-4 pentraxin-1 domain-containing protein n=1 Tax=Volvox reticuliferus TaxID=1737510 RepID=A0A8J4GKI7_9CHLO|nr:hypothetical protein Vretimale_13037 [Volvox reticuliferus]
MEGSRRSHQLRFSIGRVCQTTTTTTTGGRLSNASRVVLLFGVYLTSTIGLALAQGGGAQQKNNISNLALGRPAYSSSVYFHPGPCSPGKAVDGVTNYTTLDINNPQLSHSNISDIYPWFSVDLGSLSYIVQVVIWNRCDGFTYRMKNVELRVGNVSIPGGSNIGSLSSNPLVWTQTTAMGNCEARPIFFDPPIVGRWVTLAMNNGLPGEPYLMLTEFQVFGFPVVNMTEPATTFALFKGDGSSSNNGGGAQQKNNISNLALGRPAYSSSVYLHPGPCSPGKAVDGVTYYTIIDNNNPQVYISNNYDYYPWFSVDLGNLSYIIQVVIWNRCDGPYGHRMKNAELRIGNVSIPGGSNIGSLSSNPLVWTQTTALVNCEGRPIFFKPPIVGRWVTLAMNNSLPGEPYLQVTEFQVFGVPFVPPPPPPPSPPPPPPPPPPSPLPPPPPSPLPPPPPSPLPPPPPSPLPPPPPSPLPPPPPSPLPPPPPSPLPPPPLPPPPSPPPSPLPPPPPSPAPPPPPSLPPQLTTALLLLPTGDIVDQLRSLVLMDIGKIPRVRGSLSALVEFFWKPDTDDKPYKVFNMFEGYMAEVLHNFMDEARMKEMATLTAGLQSFASLYGVSSYGNLQKGIYLAELMGRITELGPKFFSSSDPSSIAQVLPYFITLGTLKLTMLREQYTMYKQLYGMDDPDSAHHLAALQQAIRYYTSSIIVAARDIIMNWRESKFHYEDVQPTWPCYVNTYWAWDDAESCTPNVQNSTCLWNIVSSSGDSNSSNAKKNVQNALERHKKSVMEELDMRLTHLLLPTRLWPYLDPTNPNLPVVRINDTWSTYFGACSSITFEDNPTEATITGVAISYSSHVEGLGVLYSDVSGGAYGLVRDSIVRLDGDEVIVNAKGQEGGTVNQLVFVTSKGRKIGGGGLDGSFFSSGAGRLIAISAYNGTNSSLDCIRFLWREYIFE